jgi:hypothetical protein
MALSTKEKRDAFKKDVMGGVIFGIPLWNCLKQFSRTVFFDSRAL